MANSSTTTANNQQKKAPLACRKAAKDSTKNIRKSAENGTASMQERKTSFEFFVLMTNQLLC